jgi:hypothetical protein
VTDTILGCSANVRFTLKTIMPDADTTLGDQFEREYGDRTPPVMAALRS